LLKHLHFALQFDGEAGEKMKEICALFCRNHTYALNALKERRKKDIKLQELMTVSSSLFGFITGKVPPIMFK